MKVAVLLAYAVLTTRRVSCAAIKAPLDVIGLGDISESDRKHLEYLNSYFYPPRPKRSSHELALNALKSTIAHGVASKLGQIAKGSAAASTHFSAGSSSGHSYHHDSYPESHDHKSFDYWSLKKSILNTLLQAVKAIKGGVIAIKGQLIKGSGYLVSAKGKLISAKGEAISNLGKKIATSAVLSPTHGHSEGYSHYHHSAPEAFGSPSAPGPEYEVPEHHHHHYHHHPSVHHEDKPDADHAGILIIKKMPSHESAEHLHVEHKVPDFKPIDHKGPSLGEIIGKFFSASTSLTPGVPAPFGDEHYDHEHHVHHDDDDHHLHHDHDEHHLHHDHDDHPAHHDHDEHHLHHDHDGHHLHHDHDEHHSHHDHDEHVHHDLHHLHHDHDDHAHSHDYHHSLSHDHDHHHGHDHPEPPSHEPYHDFPPHSSHEHHNPPVFEDPPSFLNLPEYASETKNSPVTATKQPQSNDDNKPLSAFATHGDKEQKPQNYDEIRPLSSFSNFGDKDKKPQTYDEIRPLSSFSNVGLDLLKTEYPVPGSLSYNKPAVLSNDPEKLQYGAFPGHTNADLKFLTSPEIVSQNFQHSFGNIAPHSRYPQAVKNHAAFDYAQSLAFKTPLARPARSKMHKRKRHHPPEIIKSVAYKLGPDGPKRL